MRQSAEEVYPAFRRCTLVAFQVAIDYRPALLGHSGIARVARELARALAARAGIDLLLFGHCLARAVRGEKIPEGARLRRLPIPGRLQPLLARIGLGADRLCGSPAVFHWIDYVHPPVNRARTVLTIHDLAFARDPNWHGASAASLLERTRAAASEASAVVVPTQATRLDVERWIPGARTVRVIPFAADHAPRAGAGPHPLRGETYVLAVGTIEPRKNHIALLEAWRRLPSPRPRLVVVGQRGWCCEDAEQALLEAEREGATWLRGAGDRELFRLMRHAAVLVYPSLWEGFGFPPLEAMALGVPVVAGDCPALREVLEDGALFADPRSPDSIAAALDLLLRDPGERRAAAERGPRRAGCFSWARCAEAHEDLYREIAP
ncbi:MAG: glycosyltransferase family 1 protein [Planctomycetota bacterium]